MYDEHEQLDNELARLAEALRGGDQMAACIYLAEFATKLDRRIRQEERALALAYERHELTAAKPLATVRSEHASLRCMVNSIALALDGAEDRRGLELVGKLRSVLVLHLAKEDRLQPVLHHHA